MNTGFKLFLDAASVISMNAGKTYWKPCFSSTGNQAGVWASAQTCWLQVLSLSGLTIPFQIETVSVKWMLSHSRTFPLSLLSQVDVVWAGVYETCWPQGRSQPQNCMQWCLESPVDLHQPWGQFCHPALLWEKIDQMQKLKTLFSSHLSNTLQNVWSFYTNMELYILHTYIYGASQVAQWLTFRLPSRICRFNPWVGKIP